MPKPIDGGRVIRRAGSLLPKTKFNMQQMADLLLEFAVTGGTVYTFPAWLVHSKKWAPNTVPHVSTIKYWIKHSPEFAEVVDLARDLAIGSETRVLDAAKLGNIPGYMFMPHKFKLMNLFGWHEKLQHSGQVDAVGTRGEFLEKMLRDPKMKDLALELAERMAEGSQSNEGQDK